MKGARYTLNKEEGYKEEERYKVNKDKKTRDFKRFISDINKLFLMHSLIL